MKNLLHSLVSFLKLPKIILLSVYKFCRILILIFCKKYWKLYCNKKVLLRERKRHTTRRVASARFADGGRGIPHAVMVGGYSIQSWWGGYPIQSWWGGTPSSHCWGEGYPHHPDLARGATPHHPDLAGGTLGTPPLLDLGWGTPTIRPGMGYPHQTYDGVSPTPSDLRQGTPSHQWWTDRHSQV